MRTLTATIDGKTVTWRNRRRYRWLLGLVVPILPFAAYEQATSRDWALSWWMGPIWILLLIPLLDLIFREDRSNPPEWAVDQLADDRFYRWCTYLFLPLQIAGLVFACWVVTTVDMTWYDLLGYGLTVGTVAGVAINTAHELGHKKERSERWMARIALAQTGYGHFYVEHNRGHHTRVATPEDPASSRLGESFWAFLPRSVVGGVRSAWELEAKRLRHQDKPVWSRDNDVLNAWAFSVVLFAALIIGFGPQVIPFLVIQAVFGFSLLEVVNYLEHYGLARQRKADGRYERTTPEHSWNSNHVASNLVLYQLERHSDHHAHPTRRYQTLRHFDESPQLPSGYGLMLGIAYITPLWRFVMDKRVLAQYDGDVTRANIQPSKRAKILARHGVVEDPERAAVSA
jgi:alkane 1-monooxygenase